MKHTFIIAIITAILLAMGCVYDYKAFNQIKESADRNICFEVLCQQKSATIDSLQAIIDGLNNNNEMKGCHIATEEFDSIALLQKSSLTIVCDSIER